MTLLSGTIRLPAASSRGWSVRSLKGRIVVYTATQESHLVKVNTAVAETQLPRRVLDSATEKPRLAFSFKSWGSNTVLVNHHLQSCANG